MLTQMSPVLPPPVGPPSPGHPGSPEPTRRKRNVARAVAIVLAVSAVALTAALVVARAQVSEVRSDLAAVTDERDGLRAMEEQRSAEQSALPDVYATMSKHLEDASGFILDGDETYASLTVFASDLSPMIDALQELGFPASIESRIGNTRALDGTLSSESDHVMATWSYHPDDGLSLVLELRD